MNQFNRCNLKRHLHRSASASMPAPPTVIDPPSQPQKINFYTNSNVLRYAELHLAPFTLRQLIFFGKVLRRHGSNLDDLNHSIIQGANFTRVQLPIRIARMIREFQSLPYIVTSNQYLNEIYKLYVDAFESLRTYPEIRSPLDNQRWCEFLGGLLNQHKVVIPKLAIGVAESATHLTNSRVEQFMTRMLHSRISRRVLVEHHIALTRQFQDYRSTDPSNPDENNNMRYLGVIDTQLEVGKVVENCIQLAKTTLISSSNSNSSTTNMFSPLSLCTLVRGDKNAKFAYIADHLEFVVFELLLNAFRATMAAATKQKQDPSSLPIEVQIVSSTTHITIRISDQAGGVNYHSPSSWQPLFNSDDDESFPFSVSRREMFSFVNLLKTVHSDSNESLIQLIQSKDGMEGKVQEQIPPETKLSSSLSSSKLAGYQSSSANQSEQTQEARLRIGLPLSSIYALFFGGTLEMNSIPGFSDIVLCIPKLGTATEPN